MSIVALATFKDYLRDEIGGAEDAELQSCLDATDELLEDICGRRWVVASGSTTRYYAPRGWSDVIRIHDCTAVTAVTNDGVTIAAADRQSEPINGLSLAGSSVPYEQIRYINSRWRFDGFRATVAVTGTFGWSAIPQAIERAALVIGKDIVAYRDIKFGTAGFTDVSAVRARQAPLIKELAKRWRREEAKAGIGGPS